MRTTRPAEYAACPVTVAEALERGATVRPTGWGLRDAAFTLGGAFLLALVMAIVFVLAASEPTGVRLVLGALVPWLAMAGWPLYTTVRHGNGPVIDLGLSVRWSDLWWGALGGCGALVLGGLVAVVTEMLVGDFNSAAAEAALDVADRWAVLVFSVLVVVGAPFAEELAFRGMLWAGLGRARLAPVAVWAITTMVFALFHFESARIAVLIVTGGMFGLLRLTTGRLGAPIIAHAVNNLPGAVAIALS